MAQVATSVVVVDRNRPDLYALLRRRLGPSASVLLDRRTRDAAPSLRQERRQPMTPAEAAMWDVFGYRLTGPSTDASANGDLSAEVDRLARQLYFFGAPAFLRPSPRPELRQW